MIEGLKPYPEYNSVDLSWIESLPKDWKVRRARGVFECVDVKSKTGKEELLTVSALDGIRRRREKAVTMFQAKSYVGHKLCWPGDLVINSLWAWMRGLGFSKYHGIVSTAYGVYRPRAEHEALWRYFNYLFRSGVYDWELRVRSKGVWTSRLQITDWSFLDMPVILPPTQETQFVVRFLDHANRKIDRFIRVKKKMIALLNEQKQAIIHRAVTRGINPDAKLTPSGIPWLGDMPSHWETRRVKQVTSILRGKFSHRPRNDSSLYDGPYPFIQTGSVARAKKFITQHTQTLNDKGLSVSKLFPKGTLCMTIAANIGDVAILSFEACFPDSIVGFVPNSKLNRDYLYFVFLCMKSELLRDAPVNTQGNLNVERIGTKCIPFPEINEQQLIVEKIEIETNAFEQAISRTEREIALMQEYRTRLTADIVTGKLDVREAAANLPEFEETAETDTAADILDEDLIEDDEPEETDE